LAAPVIIVSLSAGFFIGAIAVTRNNVLYLIIGALVVVVAVLSYQLYQDRHPPEGMSIKLGPNELSIQGSGNK
jgi:RsiW-degrading membrane proteinase PrsW (M82 family)